MKINLLRDYCGRIINDGVLLKGEHEVSETVGTYLVGKGYAVYADTPPVDVDLDTLQAEGAITVTHADDSVSTVSLADDVPAPVAPKAKSRK